MQLRYVGPYDVVEVVDLGSFVRRDEVFDIPGEDTDLAAALLIQHDNYQPVDAAAKVILEAIEASEALQEDADAPEPANSTSETPAEAN